MPEEPAEPARVHVVHANERAALYVDGELRWHGHKYSLAQRLAEATGATWWNSTTDATLGKQEGHAPAEDLADVVAYRARRVSNTEQAKALDATAHELLQKARQLREECP